MWTDDIPDYARNARFRCHKCKTEWTEMAGPHVLCRRCGNLYCTWLNHPYTLYREKHPVLLENLPPSSK